MSNILLLAEKPSVAKTLATVLGASRKEGYYEGNGYVISNAFGHLLTPFDCKDYDAAMAKWNAANFPFIPQTIQYKAKEDPKTKTADPGVKKQLELIKKLAGRSDVTSIVNAADSDREGQLLMAMILDHIKTKKPIFRLWLNEHTPDEIKRGLGNLIPNKEMKPLEDAGYARQTCDWILGINFTTVATLVLGGGQMINCGRVINPVVKMVYDRDKEIENFVPSDFYELKTTFDTGSGSYFGYLINQKKETRFAKQSDLEAIAKQIAKKQGQIHDKKVTQSSRQAPRLFNLTDLQGHITSKFSGFNASKVDSIMQKLYESQYVSYPRTNSFALDESLKDKAKKVLEVHKKGLPCEGDIRFHTNKQVFDNSKVKGHSAIIPTYIVPKSLSKDEQIVYDEIKKRFLAQFMPPAQYENTEIITQVTVGQGGYRFITKGKTLLSPGWLALYGKEAADTDKEKDDEDDQLIPNVTNGQTVEVAQAEILAKQTQPPKHYTEKTLLKAMQTCGKNVDDDDLDLILKGYEIGTPATRAEVLRKVQAVGYIETKGKALRITDMGKRFVEIFPVKEFMDVDFTGRLEKQLSDIEQGKYTKDEFMSQIYTYTKEGVATIKATKGQVGNKAEAEASSALGNCPLCGSPIKETERAYSCTGYKAGCKFAIWKNDRFFDIFKKSLTKSMVKAALEQKPIAVKGLTSKAGKKFDAQIEYILKDNGYWGWNLILDGHGKSEASENKPAKEQAPAPAAKAAAPKAAAPKTKATEEKPKAKPKDEAAKPREKAEAKSKAKPKVKTYKVAAKKAAPKKESKPEPKSSPAPATKATSANKTAFGRCPVCGREVVEEASSYACTSCDFNIQKEDEFLSRFQQRVTPSMAKEILQTGSCRVDNMVSAKTGKVFAANLAYKKEGSRWSFTLDSF